MAKYRHGLVVGKFAPFHKGHMLLLDTALAQCDKVSVWVSSRPDFATMPSPLRRGWIRELYPPRLYPHLHLLPDAPSLPPMPLNHEPDSIQREYAAATLRHWNIVPDAVFTSEDYGPPFAGSLNATHVMVDAARQRVPISGTQLRSDPHRWREYLDPAVYAHFVRRVVLLGGESTGKSTLTRAAAEHLGTAWVREYGRDVYERENGVLNPEHFLEIALGHRALEDEAARAPGVNRWVVCDTNAATTLMWSYFLTGTALPELHALADACKARYAHTFLCDTDLPHEQDGWRSNAQVRELQQGVIVQDLRTRGIPFTRLSGGVEARVAQLGAVLNWVE